MSLYFPVTCNPSRAAGFGVVSVADYHLLEGLGFGS